MELEFMGELEKLNLPKDKFALTGSIPLVLKGLKETNGDIDILVKKDLWDELKGKYGVTQIKLAGKVITLIKLGNIDISCKLSGLPNADEVIDRAEIIGGYRVVSLEDTLTWKSIAGREKDLKDVEAIKKYLKTANGAY